MSDLTGMRMIGAPFAIWPATIQMMPSGVADAAFGRVVIAVRISNTGAAAWPVTNARISPRSRQQLANAGMIVEDVWPIGDMLAFDQQMSNECVILPALDAGRNRTIFFKLDVSPGGPRPGVHDLEIELRDPAIASQAPVRASGPLRMASTQFDPHSLSFVTVADKATMTTSFATAAFDLEAFRRAVSRARTIFPPGAFLDGSPAAMLERIRVDLQNVSCGTTIDICGLLAELSSFCAIPRPNPLAPGAPQALETYVAFGDQSTYLADRVQVTVGNVGSDQSVQLGPAATVVGDATSGAEVQLQANASVSGDVTAGGVVRRDATAKVGQGIREHATYFPITVPTRSVSAGSQDISVSSGTKTLQPGSYGTVQTSAKATISLSAGLYQLCKLSLYAESTLVLDVTAGPIEIRATQGFSFGDKTVFSVKGGPGAGRIQFYSDGSDEIRIGADISTFLGIVTAPKATIHVFPRTTVRGALWAKAINVEVDCTLVRLLGASWVGQGASGLELLAYPTVLDSTIEYRDGYFGPSGPLAFDGVPWKSLLGHANLLFNLVLGPALPAAVGAAAASLVVGRVKTAVLNAPATPPAAPPPATQAGSVDAAVISLAGNRALGSPIFGLLDAQTGEPNAQQVTASNATIFHSGAFLRNTEISALLANAASDPGGLSVYKSGAASGVTRGLIGGLFPVFKRQDPSGPLNFINQLSIVPDPAFPAADSQVAASGDSGALWIHARTNKVVALGHSVGTGGAAVASRIEDVLTAVKAQLL